MDISGTEARHSVKAWDRPTRLFHWVLLLLIVVSYVSYRYSEALGDPLLKWHRWSGLAILVLIVWRIFWGVLGSSTARFSSFVRGARPVLGYLGDLVAGRERPFLGHNPAGALMVVALMGLVGTQASLGLFTVEHNDLTAGPLYRLVSEDAVKLISRWHRWLFHYVLLPAIVLHVVANILYGVLKREPLIAAMLTGRKPARDYEDGPQIEIPPRPLVRAAGLLALSALLVLGGIVSLGGRIL
ncbi:MAG: cytochrome b/b6 domain-containing protein [Hyphomicrobiaceae bacterium]|nr:cytochrome b/b6 domain-containing protein [Hyphomicrobiaceae bacterium]